MTTELRLVGFRYVRLAQDSNYECQLKFAVHHNAGVLHILCDLSATRHGSLQEDWSSQVPFFHHFHVGMRDDRHGLRQDLGHSRRTESDTWTVRSRVLPSVRLSAEHVVFAV